MSNVRKNIAAETAADASTFAQTKTDLVKAAWVQTLRRKQTELTAVKREIVVEEKLATDLTIYLTELQDLGSSF